MFFEQNRVMRAVCELVSFFVFTGEEEWFGGLVATYDEKTKKVYR